MSIGKPIKLRIPEQDLKQFSLFPLSTEAAQTWAQGLPVTNTRLVVQQLRLAISELNRTEIAPDARFAVMEVLRPNLQIALVSLSRKYLNQPLVLPEEPRQQSELASSLLALTTTAYTICAVQAIQQRDSINSVNPARLVCESLRRAIEFSGRKILQAYQLYQPVEANTWLELHQLFALGERQQLANIPVADKLSGDGSITEAYLRTLILSCCKPNQLRQTDLAGIYRGLQDWRQYLRLDDPAIGEGLFQVDLNSDAPPIYSALVTESPEANSRYIDPAPLVNHLEQLMEEDERRGKPGISFNKDGHLASNILEHIVSSLGTMSTRNFARAETGSELWITLGLNNAHYFIGGEQSFERLVQGTDSSSSQQDSDSNLFTESGGRQDPRGHQLAFPVDLVDASPGGYCLEWSPNLPGDIKTGDIVGVRESDNAEWMVAVTRWVSQLKNAKTLIGIELLSPKAMPYGARVVHTTGHEAELARVLLLPEIQLVGQPHTLVTPRTGFRERQKVSLIREGEQFYIQLLRQIATSGSFSQFDFRYIKLLEDVIAEDKSGALGATYDSIWTNI